jgi:hypothetical protein
MISKRKFGLVASAIAAGSLALGASQAAFASGAHFSNPNVTDTATLAGGATIVFSGGTIDNAAVTVTCTGFTASGTVPAKGLTVKLSGGPAITGCTDNLSGTDTITTKSSGWKLVANATGSTMTLDMPKKGATFTSSVLPTCTVTAGPAKEAGAYNDLNNESLSNAGPIKTKGKGCSTGGTTVASTTGGGINFSQNESVVG